MAGNGDSSTRGALSVSVALACETCGQAWEATWIGPMNDQKWKDVSETLGKVQYCKEHQPQPDFDAFCCDD